MTENTLILLKPDAVERKLCGEIMRRIEAKGLSLAAVKMMQITRELGETHYEMHKGKPFFENLLSFITSGPVIALVVHGESAITLCRNLAGATSPLEALPGTIRGDFAFRNPANLVHASDSPESAKREIRIFFSDSEIQTD